MSAELQCPQSDPSTIVDWVRRAHISQSLFFKLHREGKGPRTVRIGRRTLVIEEPSDYARRVAEGQLA